MLILPDLLAVHANLRSAIVLKAEDLYLTVGGDLGFELARRLTGVSMPEGLPSDVFSEALIEEIAIERWAITGHVNWLVEMLATRGFGYRPGDGALDSDFMQQEHIDFLELFLATLPGIALGGVDWTAARAGALRDLLRLATAWQRLAQVVDTGLGGDFEVEELGVGDLALIAGVEVRSMRNLVGPNRSIRTVEISRVPRSPVSARAFASVNRVDALAWLRERKGFWLAPLRPGLISKRLTEIDDPKTQYRAAVLASLITGPSLRQLAATLKVSETELKQLGDGIGNTRLGKRVLDHIIAVDLERASATALG